MVMIWEQVKGGGPLGPLDRVRKTHRIDQLDIESPVLDKHTSTEIHDEIKIVWTFKVIMKSNDVIVAF